MQFPWPFKNDKENRAYLFELHRRFRDYSLVLEVRHASWNQEAILETLSELGVGLCNIDQPLFAKSLKPSAHTTSPFLSEQPVQVPEQLVQHYPVLKQISAEKTAQEIR